MTSPGFLRLQTIIICPQVLARPRDNKDTHQSADTDFLGVCADLCGLFVVLQASYLMYVNIVLMSFTLCSMRGQTESGFLQEHIIKMHCSKGCQTENYAVSRQPLSARTSTILSAAIHFINWEIGLINKC